MRIGIDCSCLAKEERTGVARYCASFLHALVSVLEPEDRVTAMYRLSRLKRRRWFERVDDPRFSQSVFQDRIGTLPPRGLDVAHGPDLRLPLLPGVPAVSTVHDLSALDVPGIARESFKERKRAALQLVADRAARILCISEFTRNAFLTRYPQAESRTRVVPLGLADRFYPRSRDEIEHMRRSLGVQGPYLLFVGQIAARKNLLPLLRAFADLRTEARFADLQIVLAGPVQTGGDDIVERIAASGSADAVHLPGFVGDDVLPALYAGAAAFCFTGKAEGFGLPILEAMACDCPVVVADAGASASTAGGAASLIPPDDVGALRDALAGLLESASVRDDLISRGRAHAAQYSWRETARKTLEAYRSAVEQGVSA
jgi:glycosyltransferase involved in cell wall biosynthesis